MGGSPDPPTSARGVGTCHDATDVARHGQDAAGSVSVNAYAGPGSNFASASNHFARRRVARSCTPLTKHHAKPASPGHSGSPSTIALTIAAPSRSNCSDRFDGFTPHIALARAHFGA